MLKIHLKKYLITFFIAIIIFLPKNILVESFSESNTVTISATVVETENNKGISGSDNKLGTKKEVKPIDNIETAVHFRGLGYPNSPVFILQDGQVVAKTTADEEANFHVAITGLKTDSYTFGVYCLDYQERKSSSYSFPIFITSGSTVNISHIYLSPTINIDKIAVRKGTDLTVFGQGSPASTIIISVNSDREYHFTVPSNKMGNYVFNLDTSNLSLREHQSKSKAQSGGGESLYNQPVSFLVSDENILKDNKSCNYIRGDLNCDTRVNLIDFSIMAYWYKKSSPPAEVDLNRDYNISIADFSIMAFNWTG